MISAQSIVDAAKTGIKPFNPTGLGEGSIYTPKVADENYYKVTMSISGGLTIQKPSGSNCNCVFIQQVQDVVALGKVDKEQVVYTEQLQGCVWEIWQKSGGDIYGAHAYKAASSPAKTIEGHDSFKGWTLVQRFPTAGMANAGQGEMVMAFSSIGSNSVETVLIVVDKDKKYKSHTDIERQDLG